MYYVWTFKLDNEWETTTTIAKTIDEALNNAYKLNHTKTVTSITRGGEVHVPQDIKVHKIVDTSRLIEG